MLPLVVVVDDEEHSRLAIELILRDEFEVRCVEDCDAAVQVVESSQGRVKVAVVDLWMGNDNLAGLTVSKTLRKLDQAPEVIFLTGFGFQLSPQNVLASGALGFVNKTADRGDDNASDNLRAMVRHAIEVGELRLYAEVGRRAKQLFDSIGHLP